MSASINAITSYFKIPIIWLTGIITALGVMAVYGATMCFHWLVGIAVLLVFLNILPFFFAGIYGMILDGNTKKGSFSVYARYGYSRCLSPSLFILLIFILLVRFLGPFGLLILIPIFFFIYFADITAIRHNLKTGQAIKDSAQRAIHGSILVIIFYFGNLIAAILCFLAINLIFEAIVPIFVSPENLINLTTLLESAFTSASQNIFTVNTSTSGMFTDMASLTTLFSDSGSQNLLMSSSSETMIMDIANQFLETPGIALALTSSLAIGALFFMPFFVAYKAYFFRDLLIAEATVAAVVKAAQERVAQQANGNNTEDISEKTTSETPELSTGKSELQKLIPETPKEPDNSAVLAYDPHAGEDGEYDAKGRWFKYK